MCHDRASGSFQVFGDCPAGATREGAGSTGTPCQHDDQCIGAIPGTCVDASGAGCLPGSKCTCDVTACSEELFIGHLSQKCSRDSDCPDKLPGQCDTSGNTQATGTCLAPLQLESDYDFATSNYLAAGGSGFRVLQRNTTQVDTGIQQRDAVIDMIRNASPCGYSTAFKTDDHLLACSADADCQSNPALGSLFVCACPGKVKATGTNTAQTCQTSGSCDPSVGRCVRQDCRDGIATYHETMCQGSPTLSTCETELDSCSLGGEECKILGCVDTSVGAFTDNRVAVVGR